MGSLRSLSVEPLEFSNRRTDSGEAVPSRGIPALNEVESFVDPATDADWLTLLRIT